MKPAAAARLIVAGASLILAVGCYDFGNPVDPDSENYQGFRSDPPAPPAAPASLVVDGTSLAQAETQVQLTWQDVSTDEDGFEIERDGASIATVGAGVTTHLDTGLTALTTYTYRVRAYNVAGASAYADAGPWTSAPAAPTGLTDGGGGPTQIDLQWNASAGATSYVIEYHYGADPYTVLTTTPSTGYSHSPLASGAHTYRVTAANASGKSNPSLEYSETLAPTSPPAAPANLVVDGTSLDQAETQVQLTWQDLSTDEDSFEIERDGVPIATVGAGVTTYLDTGLTALTTYTYRVRAVNVAGASAYATAGAWTSAPAAPLNLRDNGGGSTQIDIRWNPSGGATSYVVEHHLDADPWAVVGTPTGDTFSHPSLPPGTHYYRVRAVSASGKSTPSNEYSSTLP